MTTRNLQMEFRLPVFEPLEFIRIEFMEPRCSGEVYERLPYHLFLHGFNGGILGGVYALYAEFEFLRIG